MSPAPKAPPRWDDEHLERDLVMAIKVFRQERVHEPLAEYVKHFEKSQDSLRRLLDATSDLTELNERASEILSTPEWKDALRYITGPPISLDDLKTLSESTLSTSQLRANREVAREVVSFLRMGLDRHRFPWLATGAERGATVPERAVAITATAAIMAARQVETLRRTSGKKAQEAGVKAWLKEGKFREVPPRPIDTLEKAPGLGEFCGESKLGTRKADVIVRLWDSRVMPIECKVSNSALNSIKRLNNDAAAKAHAWIHDFGATQVVPAAVISGVFKLEKLREAQSRGLAVFWGHDIGAMLEWIESTRNEASSGARSQTPRG